MRILRRRALALAAVAAATALGLSACSGGSVAGNSDSSSGRTTVTVWHQVTGDSTKTLNELVDKYNKSQSKYTIKTQFAATSDQFPAKLSNALKNGTAPDMVLGDSLPQSLSQYVQTGKVVPLDDKLASGSKITKDSFTPGFLATGTVDGKVYSLPTDGGDFGLVYNKQMFKDAGIDAPPTTWAEVTADAQKLTTDGRYGIYLPIGTGEWPVFTYEAMLWGAGGELLNSDNTQVAFNSPQGVTALTTWTDLIKNKLAYPSSLVTPADGQGIASLSSQKVAMVITGAYNLGILDKALGKDNVGTAKLPTLSTPAMSTGTDNSYLLKSTTAKEAGAWDFLQYWLSPSAQSTWDIASGYLPTNKATASSDEFQKYLSENPRLQPFVDQLAYARARPSILGYDGVSAALSRQIEQAMLQKTSPQDALAAAATDAQKALDATK